MTNTQDKRSVADSKRDRHTATGAGQYRWSAQTRSTHAWAPSAFVLQPSPWLRIHGHLPWPHRLRFTSAPTG